MKGQGVGVHLVTQTCDVAVEHRGQRHLNDADVQTIGIACRYLGGRRGVRGGGGAGWQLWQGCGRTTAGHHGKPCILHLEGVGVRVRVRVGVGVRVRVELRARGRGKPCILHLEEVGVRVRVRVGVGVRVGIRDRVS